MNVNFAPDKVGIGVWKDAAGRSYRNYECKLCKFSTIFPEKMEEHQVTDDHRWPYATAVQEQPDEHGFYDPTFR